jgi:hypothetical protein
MNKQPKPQEENPKRAAFKRFSKIGTAGIAVLSMSAFANISAQQLPAKAEPDSVQKQNIPLENKKTNTLIIRDEFSESDTTSQGDRYGDGGTHSLHSNYNNNYSNTYSNSVYSNHYSNYCDAQ